MIEKQMKGNANSNNHHAQMDHNNMDHKHEKHQEHDTMMNNKNMTGGHKKHQNGEHEGHKDHHVMMVNDFRRRFFFSLMATIPVLLLSPMIQDFLRIDLKFSGDIYILFAIATLIFIYGGNPFLKGMREELKKKAPAMMTLIGFAISVAYIYSTLTIIIIEGNDFFWELATLIDVMLLGHWIEMKSIMGASKALDELIKLMPEEAHLIKENGETTDIPVKELKAGDSVLIKPGEKIPIDGIVYDGSSEVDESMITGESFPVLKENEAEIVGGSVNGDGILKFKVTKTGDDTFISQIIKLVKEAQASKSNTQRLADKAATLLFYIGFSSGIITFVIWMLIGKDLSFAMARAVTVIVICCPHALGLAAPLVTAVSTSIGAKKGLLIRDRVAFENARKINTVVFDKTGTLTEGKFGITDIKEIGISKEELLSITYSVESNSEHPIAQGIVNEGKKSNLKLKKVKDYQSMPGKGLKASIDGKEFMVVSPGYMKAEKIDFDQDSYEELAKEGKTVVFILQGEILLGYMALTDIVRETAKEAIEILKSLHIETMMLTGDNDRVAAYVGEKLKIDRIISEVLPQEKESKIDELHKEGKIVAMTGDGVNDAPSLAKANLGIAIGAGTDVAIETADVILVKSNPLDVINILKLSKATYRKMMQNLIWATGYNIVAIPLAAGVLYNQGIILSPAVGAALMSLSTIIVSINARLLKIK